ncbi:MAG: histidine phosphatase family protein [Magnetococcales bacterium]|nr:histidine phosphatase family protein [Magnetococcales bacterium]
MNPLPPPGATAVDLLRHGEPEGGEMYRGSLDHPLSPLGWQQMLSAIDTVPCRWDLILHSPLLRCADFAQNIAKKRAIPCHCEPRFQEMGFGLWEGRTRDELLAGDRERLTRFWLDPLHNTPPEGEPLLDVQHRVSQAWEEMLQHYADRAILIVAHGGIIRLLMALNLGMPLENLSRVVVPYACLVRFRIDRFGPHRIPRLLAHLPFE